MSARKTDLIDGLETLWRRTPKLNKTGKFWVWENIKGTKLSKPYLNEKQLLNKIKEAIKNNQPNVKNSKPDKLFEAEVAQELFNLGKINKDKAIDFANKVNKSNAGEIDYSSGKYIVEAKTNLDNFDALDDLFKQLQKYLQKNAATEINYLNPENKIVVVVNQTSKIDETRKESIAIIKQLEKDGVIFVDGIKNLKKLY
jgi:hypothetical protein